jgi:hypothetical protein
MKLRSGDTGFVRGSFIRYDCFSFIVIVLFGEGFLEALFDSHLDLFDGMYSWSVRRDFFRDYWS